MRYSYTVTGDNLLKIINPKAKKTALVNGRFKIDKNNRLIYYLNERLSWRREFKLPHKIIFTGKWRLNENHDLELILAKGRDYFERECLTITGRIISFGNQELAFETKTLDKEGLLHLQILKISGSFFSDENNLLSFALNAQSGIVALSANWQLNNNQQISYQYEHIELKTKNKTKEELTFEGYWQINDANKLSYALKSSAESKFNFRAQVESPNIRPQDGIIKYRIGIGAQGAGHQEKIICLFGEWKFGIKSGVAFEMDYGQGILKRIEFASFLNLSKND